MANEPRSMRVEALVLRHSDWGEADRILSLFTREQGKIRAVAKGVRKLHSRKAGHVEPFTRVTLQLARGRDLWILTQAETVDAYLLIRDDLVRMSYASFVLELLDRFTYDEGANLPLYTLITDTLQRIAEPGDPFVAVCYYQVRLLDLVGFRPRLFQCAACGETIRAENQFFSAPEGGVLCPNCGGNRPHTVPVSVDALRFLRHFQRSTFSDSARAQIEPSTRSELEALLQFYFTYLLERGLTTPEFLRAVRRTAESRPNPNGDVS